MTPQERAAAPVEVRQALADKVKNLIVSNLTHEENQLWLANVDAFEERAYQRGRRAALLEAAQVVREFVQHYPTDIFIEPLPGQHGRTVDACSASAIRAICPTIANAIDRLAQEG